MMDGGRKRVIIMFLFPASLMALILAIGVCYSTFSNNDVNIKIVNRSKVIEDNNAIISAKDFEKISDLAKKTIVKSNKSSVIGIREASYKEVKRSWGATEISFIADMIGSGVSYKVLFEHDSDDVSKMSFVCASTALARNPEAFCEGTNFNSSISANMDSILPYYGEGDFKDKYRLDYISKNDKSKLELAVFTKCNDQAAFDAALGDAKEVIRKYGMDPEQVPITISRDYCQE
jgi:hypothetical protein